MDWISCKDRLPKKAGQDCWCYIGQRFPELNPTLGTRFGLVRTYKNGKRIEFNCGCHEVVTHWILLPTEPPTEDSE